MKVLGIVNRIKSILIRLLNAWSIIKYEQFKAAACRICRKYDRTRLIYLAVCIMLIPVSLALHSGAVLQKGMKPVVKEEQAADPAPLQGPSVVMQQEAAAGRAGTLETSRGGGADRESVILLARVIEGEAADEPYQGKVAVGAVILNRTKNADFPHTIPGVIYDLDAFESVGNGQIQRPLSQDSVNAAVDAINGSDPTGGALYFWNPAKASSPWVWSRPIVLQIGRHVFAR